jgi:hypothetical protein
MIVVLVKVLVSVVSVGIVMSLVMDGPTDKYLTQSEIDEILNSQESK